MWKKRIVGIAVLSAVLWQWSLQAQANEVSATTSIGAEFTRDTSRPELGRAWKDPSGMIWGDAVRNRNGATRRMNQYQAQEYCRSIGADLPTYEDFFRLSEYLAAQPGTYRGGYHAQILPRLRGRIFWSSSPYPGLSDVVYVFHGGYGEFGPYSRGLGRLSVRCVAR